MPGEEISHAPLFVRGDPLLQIVGCGDGPEAENRMILTKGCCDGNLVRAVNDVGKVRDKIETQCPRCKQRNGSWKSICRLCGAALQAQVSGAQRLVGHQ